MHCYSIWDYRHALHDQWCDVLEGKSNSAATSNGSHSNSQGAALWAILDKLAANLKAEQQAYCQQHHQVFRQLLSHTQVSAITALWTDRWVVGCCSCLFWWGVRGQAHAWVCAKGRIRLAEHVHIPNA